MIDLRSVCIYLRHKVFNAVKQTQMVMKMIVSANSRNKIFAILTSTKGCPDRKVVKNGFGRPMLSRPPVDKEFE